MSRVVVVGFARTGRAVARELSGAGDTVVVVDDGPAKDARAEAERLGVELVASPEPFELGSIVVGADLVVVSPGVAPSHPIFSVAPRGIVVSEVELASRRARTAIVAVTGTNGKTTVTSLVASMLVASGIACRPAGNIGLPLIEAVRDPALELVVAEVSSFQLALTDRFHPKVAAWLNLAEDHLDWHGDMEAYTAAKARIFANLGPCDVAVANAEDPVVLGLARGSGAGLVTFGLDVGDYHLDGDRLVGPEGLDLTTTSSLERRLPHDVTNALASFAVALAAGGEPAACVAALEAWSPLEHRVSLVGSLAGVDYYDDAKATTPSAVAAAIAGFDSVVLIAGGRNKGLDLSGLRRAAERADQRVVRAVVAIGEAAGEVEAAFSGYEVRRADSMDEAVAEASKLAQPGDVVLLSPGCASFDWYRSYDERGADFVASVARLGESSGAPVAAASFGGPGSSCGEDRP